MPRTLFPIAALLLLLMPPPAPFSAAGQISTLCNVSRYTAGDPFAVSLAYVLSDLIAGGSASPGKDYYSISPYPNAFAYGHAFCSGNCSDCFRAAAGALGDGCPMAIGARTALRDCALRYEQYPFL